MPVPAIHDMTPDPGNEAISQSHRQNPEFAMASKGKYSQAPPVINQVATKWQDLYGPLNQLALVNVGP